MNIISLYKYHLTSVPKVFHVCGRRGEKYSFLCPNGTIFHQNYLTCDFWYNSDCSQAENSYSVNERIESEREQEPLAEYVGQVGRPVSQNLPVYSPAVRDQYGRSAKALELEESVSLTSTPASPRQQDYEDYDYSDDQANTDITKRDLNLLGRQSQKYSWSAF